MPESPERTALYRLYDTDGQLLYIGITNDPDRRWTQHARSSRWWPAVATKQVEWLGDRRDALRAEKAEVKRLNPPYNRNWNPWEVRARLQYQDHLDREAAIKERLAVRSPGLMRTEFHDPD
ncbi:GIY-YIG nuclease family protein [Streptomyces sp. NPDC056704]|uniref:GIY-YIG nuclease family protein n=1 Tax=Streptomyces sp. NPDC056704 TaxID=3345917 RepID=UPI0036C3E4B6